ncbi:hypothetical protein [Nostoc sp.]
MTKKKATKYREKAERKAKEIEAEGKDDEKIPLCPPSSVEVSARFIW